LILPIPEWFLKLLSKGVVEPVKINCPFSFLLSISYLMEFQIKGISCHSSINRGGFLFKNSAGFLFASNFRISLFVSSCIYISLLANCLAVVDLPHHLGPFMMTAPLAFK